MSVAVVAHVVDVDVGGAAAEVVDAQRVAFARRDALESNDDPLLLAGIERKDSRAQQPVAHPFDERGIALRAHDVLVDAARIAGVHRLAGHELAVDRQLEILKRGVAGQRKEVVRLADRGRRDSRTALRLHSEARGRRARRARRCACARCSAGSRESAAR